MKSVLPLVAALLVAGGSPVAAAQQSRRPTPATPPANAVAQAYEQFLLAHRLEEQEDIEGAIAAYKRAMTLDPKSADIVAELADLYMRQNRAAEAITTADQALKISPENRDAHRVLGTVYGSLATSDTRASRETQRENLTKGIQHLEQAVGRAAARLQADINVRAMLARLYVANEQFAEAIPLLSEILRQEPGWFDGATLLVQAYASSGRVDEAIAWLEQAAPDTPQLYGTLADFYSRARRWDDASKTFETAMKASPRNFELRVRYGSMLLSSGTGDQLVRARDVLSEAVNLRATDERALYLLSQAERRTGAFEAAERTARKLIAQNRKNPRGYSALAEALEERQRYQEVAEALGPAVAAFRSDADSEGPLSLLLPHLGFAYQRTGQFDRAVSTFKEAREIADGDPTITMYLIQAQIAAKRYADAAALAHEVRGDHPDDLRLARLEADALRLGGKPDEGIAILEDILHRRSSDPTAYIAVAQIYSDANRGPQAVKLLQDARAKFPSDTSITFELGAVFEKQKKYADAETAFRQVIAQEPEHAAALNYLGYMLAERGERLSESVDLIKRALRVEPENGSYLDSLGWAYYKDGQFDLAEDYLKRASDQLTTNSVVQDHYGDVLVKLGRLDDAIAAWARALSGDGDDVDRGEIDRKIRAARQKLPKR
jgi:tetratricopeptide (TPR) repeat protein